MTIGGSIGLIIVGAILAFAVTDELAGIDITVIGLIFGLTLRQRQVSATRPPDDPPL